MLLDHGEKRIVGVLVALLKNMLEVPSRLMRVDDQDEVKRGTRIRRQAHVS
jgi:hypothetical protein